MKKNILSLLCLSVLLAAVACSGDDSFTTSSSAQLTFSTDTVRMDTVFSNTSSPTYSFWVHNPAKDGLRIGSVRLRSGNQTGFRVNFDGTYLDNSLGAVANDFELRGGDSLRVFVELTAMEAGQKEPREVADQLVFSLESGVQQQVELRAWTWDALRVSDLVVSSDTTICSDIPIVVYGNGLRVDSGAVLTLRATTLYFHDQAGIDVYGTLNTEGVVLRGDRLDHMFPYLPYDRVSGQWRGIRIAPTSKANTMVDTEIRNTMDAIIVSGDTVAVDTLSQQLAMTRCTLHNCKGYGLLAFNAYVSLSYCQLTNTLGDCLAVYGGKTEVDHCTLAQFYPFSADRGAALRFGDRWEENVFPWLDIRCQATIITGYEDDQVFLERSDEEHRLPDSRFTYHFDGCLLRTPAVEDDTLNFKAIRWETPQDSIQGKQHFAIIDEDNLYYDFHLDSLSTAQGLGCY